MEDGMGESGLINRNIVSSQGRTSMRLEPELWSALDEMCRRERLTVAMAVQAIESGKPVGSRTSAVRVHLLRYFREAATDEGHARAGHGALPG
jgi:predicted DNA-binding ribbon-helix-helix protein